MNISDFEYLQGLVRRRAGLLLWSEKKFFADKQATELARELGVTEDALMEAVRRDDAGDPARRLVEAMLPEETAFFRDHLMFADLAQTVLPRLAAARKPQRRVRVLCAGMGAGQEAYSVAIIAIELAAQLGVSVEVVGTDVSRKAVTSAASGRFTQMEIQKGLSIHRIMAHFHQVGDAVWEVVPGLRQAVTARGMNLLQPAHELGMFDLVLLRNVLSTADPAVKGVMLGHVLDRLAPDGMLMLGATETLIGLGGNLVPVEGLRGFYARTARAAEPLPRSMPLRAAAG